ncbi:MAG: VOC family protein [Hyphomicrobiales bacterium]|nr:VOC family protein [Hyphomicrobiales bacterium]
MPDFQMPAKDADARFSSLRSSHACLRVPDYEASKSWFMDRLDFRLVVEWPGPLGVKMAYLAAADDDQCVVEIVGDAEPPSPVPDTADLFASFSKGGYHHVCFTVPNIDDAVTELRKRDVTIVAAPFEVEEIGRRIAFFADPFGNLFELEQKRN